LSDKEVEWALAAGMTGVRLGARILRTETAGPAAIAALQSLFGDA
jgi:16S rRNA (uracil1498-N3)-methyltransferase